VLTDFNGNECGSGSQIEQSDRLSVTCARLLLLAGSDQGKQGLSELSIDFAVIHGVIVDGFCAGVHNFGFELSGNHCPFLQTN